MRNSLLVLVEISLTRLLFTLRVLESKGKSLEEMSRDNERGGGGETMVNNGGEGN